MRQGMETAIFGEGLVKEYGNDFLVFFDHGNRQRLKNVTVCKAFYGDTVQNINRLADVDIVIADNVSENVLV